MTTPMLWHGSAARFETFGERDILTRLYAYWTTPDPVLAALYAGPNGWVHPVAPTQQCRILDASGWPGVSPLHPISPAEYAQVTKALNDQGYDTSDEDDGTPFADNGRVLHFTTRKGYHGKGPIMPGLSWEAVLQEPEHDNEAVNEAVRRCGYNAALCVDPTPGMIGDIERRTSHSAINKWFKDRNEPRDWSWNGILTAAAQHPHGENYALARLCLERLRASTSPKLTVAFFAPEALCVAGPAQEARHILHAEIYGMRPVETPPAVLKTLCVNKAAPAKALRAKIAAPAP